MPPLARDLSVLGCEWVKFSAVFMPSTKCYMHPVHTQDVIIKTGCRKELSKLSEESEKTIQARKKIAESVEKAELRAIEKSQKESQRFSKKSGRFIQRFAEFMEQLALWRH